MAPFSCSEFRRRLESWFEGERDAGSRAHVRDCAQCRGLVADFDSIQAAARELGSLEMEPPERIWVSLSAQLVREGLIRDAAAETATTGVSRGWFRNLGPWLRGSAWGVRRPVFAAGYLAALIAIAFSLRSPIQRYSVNNEWRSRTETASLNEQLVKFAQRTEELPATNPAVTASLHENLAIVDNYIALCEKSVREEPQNEIARDYLYDAYEQKAYLLAQLADRGD